MADQSTVSPPVNSPYVLGIRREDKNRWERRAPLAPAHVKELAKRGIKVIVQPSSLRTFSDMQYQQAGAIIDEDLSTCNVICCVKEVPMELLMPNKTYMFFTHTIKAQPSNMPMLDDILKKNIRIMDYELITDSANKRLVRFGKFAGYAGMIDTLHALGDRLLGLGHSTPFLHLGYSYCYSTLDTAREAVKAMGEEIGHYGLPEELVPLTFAFTSQGNVSVGAQDIFKLLPHKMLTPDEMADLVKNKHKASPFMVYGTVITAEDYVRPNDEKSKYDKTEYYAHPEKHHSIFYEKFAPHLSVIVNCMYWDHRFPRIITINQMKELVEQKRSRLIAVGDISCDTMGSIEFLLKTTSIDQPLFIYDPINGELHDSQTNKDYIYKPGVMFCAVDNFPTEFPKEATQWFGDHLLPFMEAIVKSNPALPFEKMTDLPQEIHKAVLACHGQLTPKFKYIVDLRKEYEKRLRSILVLGAGYVSKPCIDYLCRNPSNKLTLADINLEAAKNLVGKRTNVIKVVPLDVNNPQSLDSLVGAHNVIISLLPAALNVIVGESCLRNKKNLVTASYVSPKLKEMHEVVSQAGITFLNEIGLDPGIDHLEARRVIDGIHGKGGKVKSFVSWCGGIPLPEHSCNPLGYKFSWSPRGVLSASTKDSRYLQDGKIVDVKGSELFKHRQPIGIFPGFSLEGIPNRDATAYVEQYGIAPGEVDTFFRGTLRYKGWSEIMEAVVEIGLLDESPQPHLAPTAAPLSWDTCLRKLLKGENTQTKTKNLLKRRLRADYGFPTKGYHDDQIRKVVDCFDWLGMFSNKPVSLKGTYIDSFCDLLQSQLQYEKDENDMIILHHTFEVEWANGEREILSSTLVVHGNSEVTAMGLTVGLPVAIAAELLLQGQVTEKGVIGPMNPEIYRPMLKSLSNEGIKFIEKSTKLRK